MHVKMGLAMPFNGFELLSVKPSTTEIGLWEITCVPRFSEDVSVGDLVAVSMKSAEVLALCKDAGYRTYGLLYDPKGTTAERDARDVGARDYLAGLGIKAESAAAGVLMAAVPEEIDDDGFETATKRCPVPIQIHTEHARFAIMNMACPNCGYTHKP